MLLCAGGDVVLVLSFLREDPEGVFFVLAVFRSMLALPERVAVRRCFRAMPALPERACP